MLSPRLLVLATAALCVSAQAPPPPALNYADQQSTSNTLGIPSSNLTDVFDTAKVINQTGGAPADDTPPGLPPASTMATAIDGEIGLSNISDSNLDVLHVGAGRRDSSDYELVFAGTADNDAPIQGTAYLTYTLVSNSSYKQGTAECLDFCTQTDGCVFVNLYYEFNNRLLDFVFPQHSNLKCVLFGDVHTENEKVNYWDQQLVDQSYGTTSTFRNSSGFASLTKTERPPPEGYELVFGPISNANNAPSYMGFALLDKYDVSACAKLCNTRRPDSVGGACKYFNIWRAVAQGKPKTYTCAMYSAPTDKSTAVNTGQGPLNVTLSRGYKRISHIYDGDFEEYSCPNNDSFCFSDDAGGWVGDSSNGGQYDATIFHYSPYAHQGTGTLTPLLLDLLEPGKEYVLQFFHSSTYSGEELEAPAFMDVIWTGASVGNITRYSPWAYSEFTVNTLGGGGDWLQFKGGAAPAYVFIDDVDLFLK
ncbi:Fruit-body specific protein a [Mycena sanguinolenta]|uniref:Fruit-body specific protein a n=1 Tax=Mycena sanguinolenta TaxID=230812 RepID=A0A8H6Z490_9AGAR|nr:Fruit-body specific protein a [Mycena sanguinolenta]